MDDFRTSAFRGFTAPLKDLIDEIHSLGWSVAKIDLKGNEYKASAKSKDGKKMEAIGPTDNAALGHLLLSITRDEAMRHRAKISKWKTDWVERLEEVAQAYVEAPVYDPKAVPGWNELADDCKKRAKVISEDIDIELVNDPVPYKTVDEMIEDVRDKQKIKISTAATEHPIWSSDEVMNFRLVHNIIGHCAVGGDWGWHGENLATAAHLSVLDPIAQKALFTESIGQAAALSYYRTSMQKIVYLEEFIEEAQQAENKPGWGGSHPSQTILPGKIPSIEKEGATKYSSDPNNGWKSLVDPLPSNAYLWARDDQGRDPLNLDELKDKTKRLDSRWMGMSNGDGSPDYDSQKQAVANAFRAILMSERKSLKDIATHYQDIAHIPPTVDDPLRYWKALQKRQDDFNRLLNLPPDLTDESWNKEAKQFRSWVKGLHPELDDEEVYEISERQLFHMIAEEEDRIIEGDDKGKLSAAKIEEKAKKSIQKRLKKLVKPNYDERTDFGDELARFANAKRGYPAFLASQTKAVAAVSNKLDEIYQAALEDASNGGTGHLFRPAVLNMELPGVGPQEISAAWMLLAPQTSQLARIGDEMAEMLGYKEAPSERDYFKLERQLLAGRDAAGYGHIPLGMFGLALWNNRQFGQGNHPDFSPLKVIGPSPSYQSDYPMPVDEWEEPEWWRDTQEVRDMVGKHWDHTIAPAFPSDTIPKVSSNVDEAVDFIESYVPPSRIPWFINEIGEEISGAPGQTMMAYLKQTLGLSTQEIWKLQLELGKRNEAISKKSYNERLWEEDYSTPRAEGQMNFGPFMNCPDCDVPYELVNDDYYYPEAYPFDDWSLACPQCGEEAGHQYEGDEGESYRSALELAKADPSNTPALDYDTALENLLPDARPWGDLMVNGNLAEEILEVAKRRNEIPQLISAFETWRESIYEDFRALEEMNWEYLQPDRDDDPEFFDEDEDTLWDEWYESNIYKWRLEELEEGHDGMTALKEMKSVLKPYMEANNE